MNVFVYRLLRKTTVLRIFQTPLVLIHTEHRLLFYNAYIKQHFDYCSTIWSNSSNTNIYKVTKLQRRACKMILGHEYNDLNGALEKLDMLSFDQSIFLSKNNV